MPDLRREADKDRTPEVKRFLPSAIFVVLGDGLMIHGAYRHGGDAELHARCVGASVVAVLLLDSVPPSVLDARLDEYDDAKPTAVSTVDLSDILG